MFTRLLSAIATFWRALIGKAEAAPKENIAPDVDEVARNFYSDLLDSERKRKQ